MNDAIDAPLSITEDQLFAIIGRLHVENLALRAQLAALRQNGTEPTSWPADMLSGTPSAPAPHTTSMASPNE